MTVQQFEKMTVATTPTQALIEISNLKKSYTLGEVPVDVLRDIDMQIGAGEIGIILGPSGSGKTTLMNIVWPAPDCSYLGSSWPPSCCSMA